MDLSPATGTRKPNLAPLLTKGTHLAMPCTHSALYDYFRHFVLKIVFLKACIGRNCFLGTLVSQLQDHRYQALDGRSEFEENPFSWLLCRAGKPFYRYIINME